jgi:uncharacterized protein with NRDE domain
MCLIIVAWRQHPTFPCVVAANRDEFLVRPTEPAHWWPGEPQLLAGRDLQAGGTWLGATATGRFAALTNYRDRALQREGAPSRGTLVTQLLRDPQALPQAMAAVARSGADCNPWNLLAGEPGGALYHHASTTGETRELPAGLYVLSNHLLDTPWPKVLRARDGATAALAALPGEGALLALLGDRTLAPDGRLPDTGVGLEWERQLSAIHIRMAGYGTRCSTLYTVDSGGNARLREWSWGPLGEPAGERDYAFRARGT